MRHACTSPGSRSTPLVLPLVRHEGIRCWSHVDERSAGFFAIGVAKATGDPVAVTCTSGTAAANLTPAVHEAREGGVPLVVLTADRPPELREVGAGQVIDQVKLYGEAAKWFFEVGNHAATPDRLRWIRQLAYRAVRTAGHTRPGVVHLNFPLRDPLVTPEDLPPDESGRPGGVPFLRLETPRQDVGGRVVEVIGGHTRGIVVAGTGAGPAAAAYAAGAGFPLLADPLSGARTGPAAIAHYDLLLRDGAFTGAHRPEIILRVGDLPTSKPLRAWLTALAGVEQVLVPGPATWPDPMATAGVLLDASLDALDAPAEPDPTWLAAWRDADDAAAEAIDSALGDDLSEPQVARELGRRLPDDATLWVASSMPVRDVEAFFGVRDDQPSALANRGANGIDGTVSSAFGAAAAGEGPVVLLIGDVALLHDAGGLLAASRLGLSLTIVLIDNDGGGIFAFLPISDAGDAYVEHVATPHGRDFVHLAALYGCAYEQPKTLDAFRTALDASLRGAGTTILHLRSDREANRALHRTIAEAVTAAGGADGRDARPR